MNFRLQPQIIAPSGRLQSLPEANAFFYGVAKSPIEGDSFSVRRSDLKVDFRATKNPKPVFGFGDELGADAGSPVSKADGCCV